MADARKDRRTLLSLKIRYKSATLEDFIERYSMDISRGGVFIKAKRPLTVGTLLKFEFMLQDESTLIHGVGRVVWRREETESDEHNPSGMGIKFIKMDPDSRSTVQRIVEVQRHPGVFEQGKDGVPAPTPTDPEELADPTQVRHVSEFLATALEEGGAGDATTHQARVGAERARRASQPSVAARGAFSAPVERGFSRPGVSDAPARGAMSAFGGSTVTAGGARSSAAPALDELDADDDFLDNETTKVQQLPVSEFPDADATVVAADASPFVAEKRATPVVAAPSSPLEEAVPDLFGPDSFGPAPGELIDASLLDPAVPTVPPKASALPRGAVPDAPAIPSEAFKVPQAPAPVGTEPPSVDEKSSRTGLVVLLVCLLVAAAGVGAWQLGLLDDAVKLAGPFLGDEEVTTTVEAVEAPPVVEPQVDAAATPTETEETATETEETPAPAETEAVDTADEAPAADDGLVKLSVVSVPTGAFVSINGKGAGRTPLQLEYEAGTKLSFFAKARGFLARRQQVTVDPSAREVKLVLASLPYVVEVTTEPAGAKATAVGGGQTTTPGQLKFRSIPGSRKIVISKDGYETATHTVKRASFVEERSRMLATVRVSLAKDGAPVAPAPEEPSTEPATPVEAKASSPSPAAEADTPAAPEPEPQPKSAPVAEPSAESAVTETAAADAP